MMVGVLAKGEPGVFRTLILPETADALAAGEPVTALALTEGDVAAGVLAGYLEGEHFAISSLYISPDYRRRGGGRLLMEQLEKILSGHVRSVQVNMTMSTPEAASLIPFLEKLGFYRETREELDSSLYLITLGEILKESFFASGKRGGGTPLAEISDAALSLAEKRALAEQDPLPPGGLRGELVDREVSVALERDGRVEAYAVIDRSWPGGLTLSAVWSGSRNPIVVPRLLRALALRTGEKYPPDTPVMIAAVSGVSDQLLRTLLPSAQEISRTYIKSL